MYKLQEDAFANKIEDLFSFPKQYSVFLHHFWFWRRRFLKEMHFLAHFCTLCALDEAVVLKFVGIKPIYMCGVCRCSSFLRTRGLKQLLTTTRMRTRGHGIRIEEEILLS
jgi:hypothetical protein